MNPTPSRRQFFADVGLLAGLPGVAFIDRALAADSGARGGGELPLPPLPCAPDMLESVLGARTLRFHHGKYFAAERIGLMQTLETLRQPNGTDIRRLWDDLAHFAAGYVHHTVYFQNLAPPGREGTGRPTGHIAERIDYDFGSCDALKVELAAIADGVRGNGWVILGWYPLVKRLVIAAIHGHTAGWPPGLFPLLTLDLWEHAYTQRYEHRRSEYVDKWWSTINWDNVAKRYGLAVTELPRT